MILLDTQVVVWLFGDHLRLGRDARRTIEQASDRRVSAMVSWEIAMLADKGRLALKLPLAEWLAAGFGHVEASEIAVTGGIARDAGSLAGGIHGDPCDRIMIATARALDCPLVTADRAILAYADAGHLKAIDARA